MKVTSHGGVLVRLGAEVTPYKDAWVGSWGLLVQCPGPPGIALYVLRDSCSIGTQTENFPMLDMSSAT